MDNVSVNFYDTYSIHFDFSTSLKAYKISWLIFFRKPKDETPFIKFNQFSHTISPTPQNILIAKPTNICNLHASNIKASDDRRISVYPKDASQYLDQPEPNQFTICRAEFTVHACAICISCSFNLDSSVNYENIRFGGYSVYIDRGDEKSPNSNTQIKKFR